MVSKDLWKGRRDEGRDPVGSVGLFWAGAEPELRREAREGGGVSRRGSPPDH